LKRNYEIVAKNEPDMENWIRELQNVINKSTSNVDKDDKKENESEKKKKSDELYSSEKDEKKKSWT